ncbi:LutC/YkgG family protein [Novispirillum sp. DQ9]|uniref:LutC/YkgG family protein n=1 Tax=Novispirillum sp. DQ9 TaxID=3398612 RepID=UPI003C7C0D2F
MTDTRAAILDRIRRAHGRGALPADAQARLRQGLAAPQPRLVPARARLDHDAQVTLFADMAQAVAATVVRVAGWAAVPEAVADYLKGHNLPTELAVAPDARLDGVAAHGLFTARRGAALPQDVVGVSAAFAGIAETGTLLLVSGPETPTSLNFLPDVHVVAVAASDIGGTYEDAWARLRTRFPQTLPRTVNLITGPSRTGDIEQTIQLGAHGPRRLHIVLVDDRATA